MDDNTIRVAIGLRLGVQLCRPHTCHHCGAGVDSLATHGLNCRWSEGRHHRHAALNDIIHRALSSAKIPARLEPSGSYGKRHLCGTLEVWQVAGVGCPDTFAPSYSSNATSEAGIVAASAEERKEAKYSNIGALHCGYRDIRRFWSKVLLFVRELGRRITRVTGEVSLPTTWCRGSQWQHGNSAAVLGTMDHDAAANFGG